MENLTSYRFARGETILLALDAIEGNAGDSSSQAAKLRRLAPGATVLDADDEIAAAFTVTYRAVNDDIPEGWNLTIAAAESADLEAGRYLADMRLVVGSGVETTDPVIVEIYEPATVTA